MEYRRMVVATFVRRFFAAVLCMLGCMLLAVASIGQAVAGTAAPGYAVTDFATGFVNSGIGGIGPIGLAFDASGNLFVGNYFTGFLYKFGGRGIRANDERQRTVPRRSDDVRLVYNASRSTTR